MKPLDKLNDDIERGRVVFVAGAGVTMSATNGGRGCSWTELIRSGLQYCVDLGRKDKRWQDLQLGLLDKPEAEDLVRVADALQSTLSSDGDTSHLYSWLKETVGSLVATNSDVLDALVQRNCLLATTNYDDLLAKASRAEPITWLDSAPFFNVLKGDERGVLHLHGFWRRPESIVLGTRSYLSLLERSGPQAMQQLLSGANTLVFLGFGLGFTDPNFARLTEWMVKAYKGTEAKHFQLILSKQESEYPHHLRSAHIDPIVYGASHDALSQFLSRLAVRSEAVSDGSHRSIQPPSSVPPDPANPPEVRREPSLQAPSSFNWDLHRLQKTEYGLKGRVEETKRLMDAWREPKGRVVVIEGPGGAGKTAIVREFLERLRFPGTTPPAENVFGWTFDNQGQENFQSTAIGFVIGALKHFGCPPDGPLPFGDLIKYLREHRCILVLDGLETQPRDDNGNLTQYNNEEGLRRFLLKLCERDLPKGGLVLITSKEPVKEIAPAWNTELIPLEGLDDKNGAILLQSLGVQGPPEELQRASAELSGNPLALQILGSFLNFRRSSIYDRGRMQLPTKGDQSLVVNGVIRFYTDKLAPDEQQFLRLLGLFGRPMKGEDLDALQEDKCCAAAEFLTSYKPQAREALVSKLRALRLLNKPERRGLEEQWDTHPLVRQHFAEQLRNNGDQWREAHGKLFDYYSRDGYEDLFDSYKVLDLFGAVQHGCLAGRYSDAYHVYKSRIAGNFKGYDTENSPFAGEALLALSSFFEDRAYTDPVAGLDQYERAWLLARVSYCLHSLGDLAGAIAPRIASNRIYGELLHKSACKKESYENARDAAYGAEMLSQIYKRLGELGKSASAARDAVKLADASEKDEAGARSDVQWKEDYREEPVPGWLRLCSTQAALGTALHRQGKFDEADRIFRRAAERHSQDCPLDRKFAHCPTGIEPVFHSEPGVWWLLLRLDIAETAEELGQLQTMSNRMKKWSEQVASKSSVPVTGLHRMISGMVKTELADLLRRPKIGQLQLLTEASSEMTLARSLMKESRKYHFLCDVLVAMARISRLRSDFARARADLYEAWQISERCGMRLTQVDTLILQAHLHLDEGQSHEDEATKAANIAGKLIDETKYITAQPALRLLEWRLRRLQRPGIVETARVEARLSLDRVPIPRLIREFTRYEHGDWKP